MRLLRWPRKFPASNQSAMFLNLPGYNLPRRKALKVCQALKDPRANQALRGPKANPALRGPKGRPVHPVPKA